MHGLVGVWGRAGGLAQRHRTALAAALGLLLVIGTGYRYYSLSPGYIIDHALKALKRRDASALVSLASDTERRSMDLTPRSVEALLRQTWWRKPGVEGSVRVTGRRTKFADVLVYGISVAGFSTDHSLPSEVQVYRDRTGRWRLGLSELLYSTPMLCNGMTGDYARTWDRMAAAAGVRGVASADGGTRWNNGTFRPEVRITAN